MRRREGPHRFIQKRPPTFVSALQRVSAVETSKNQLSRDFRCCSIFDFCNSIGAKRTSAFEQGRATVPHDAEWGERFFHLIDPDGHELSFARPLLPVSVQ